MHLTSFARRVGMLVAAAVAVLVLAAPAAATAAPTMVSITVSPLHLTAPIVELTGEFRLTDQISVAAILGGGNVDIGLGTAIAYEFGAQGRYYVTGSFDGGLHVGAEALKVGLGGSGSSEGTTVGFSGEGFSVGAFAGYKHTFGFGLVLEAQLGYQKVFASGAASAEGTTVSGASSDAGPLLNLNIGYAF